MTASRSRHRPSARSTPAMQPVRRPAALGAPLVEVARALLSFPSWHRCPEPAGVLPAQTAQKVDVGAPPHVAATPPSMTEFDGHFPGSMSYVAGIDPRAFCKIHQSAGFIAGKDCDSRERGRPARTRPGREVAIGLTDLVGSPYDRRRAAALQECGRDARAPGGGTNGQPGADPSRACRS